MATLGERLKMLRKEKRMTQMELAELLNQSLRAYGSAGQLLRCQHGLPDWPQRDKGAPAVKLFLELEISMGISGLSRNRVCSIV